MLNNKWYRLAYEYHQKWSPYPKTEDDWRKAAEEAGLISDANGNDPLLMDLITAVLDDFGREWKKRGEIIEEGI